MKKELGLFLLVSLVISAWYTLGYIQGYQAGGDILAECLTDEYERGRQQGKDESDPAHGLTPVDGSS